jgi:flagellar basal body P-ring protein FlgI
MPRPTKAIPTLLTALLLLTLIACSGIEKAGAPMESARAARDFDLQVNRIMRGTIAIASETVVVGYQPVVVRGYGLVVGLSGTGSRDLPPQLRQHMVQEMARRGIGQASSGFPDLKPEAMLDSLDTAVVVVEGVVPPGAVGRQTRRGITFEGTVFDIRVSTEPRTGTTSLEGGRLYTTELRPGALRTGSRQAAVIAEAHGPIFLNPFAEPNAMESSSIQLTAGRILNGGEVTEDVPIKLRLASPSHVRSETIQNSINAQFPREPGQADETARGESDEVIRITVPMSFRSRPSDFVELLRHTTIRRSQPEAVASSVARLVRAEPASAYDATWRWEALGVRSLDVVRDLYESAEEQPRLAALRAGAHLDDPIATPHLIEMSESDSPEVRRQAVGLLGAMQIDPRIDRALRTRLNDDDVDVRLAAYEGLAARGDPLMNRYRAGGKFDLDVIESDKPMVYITQTGHPRIVIFGEDLAIEQPILLDTWSGRLIVQDLADGELEVYYRPERDGSRLIQQASPQLSEFVQFLAHKTTIETPEPGLDLTYSQTVGALYQIWRQKFLHADFKAEQDRILAAIRRQEDEGPPEERPEFGEPLDDQLDDPFFTPEGEAGDTAPHAEPIDPADFAPPPISSPSPN